MSSDLFILVPCNTITGFDNLKILSQKKMNAYAKSYLDNLSIITKTELVDRVSKSFDRYYLGEYDLAVLSDEFNEKLEEKHIIDSTKANLFITACERTKLAVLTIVICDYLGNSTNILDQVTREELAFKTGQLAYLEDFLFTNFQIIKNGEAKTCLIQNQKSDIKDVLYYMANETNDSGLVETKIISEKYKKFSLDNVAVYDFSDIYVSESVVYQVINDKNTQNKLQYEGLLIFIVELLVMKLSAIYRTNNKVQKSLEEDEGINVKEYEKLSNEFANTLSIWQINIYRYKGAQTIADTISERFEIDKVRENYKDNDEMLQNIINTRNVKNAMKESNILFYVAILLFIKDFFIIVRSIFLFFSGTHEFSSGDIFGLSTSFVTLLIVLFIYHSRFKNLGKRRS